MIRLLLALMASLGFYIPGNRLYHCASGKDPIHAPQSCQVVKIKKGSFNGA